MFFSGVFGLVRPTDSPETMEMSNSQISHDSNSDDAVKIVSDEVDEILSHRNESLRLGSIQELIPDTQAFSSEISTSFSKTETIEAKLQTILASKTPWGRVKEIYYLDLSPSDNLLVLMRKCFSRLPAIVGCLYGITSALEIMPTAMDTFMRQHRSSVWLTTEMARRRLSDTMILNSLTFGVARGVRLYAVAYTCLMGPLLLQAYRGHSSFWEYGAIWGMAFPLFFFGQGPRFMALIGTSMGVFGLGAGSLYFGLSHFSDGILDFENLYADYLRLQLTVPYSS